jgi:alanine-glyoxylate transaminase/serine-glyoxylate transaminase/serine-pyruvate transaminase
MGDDELMLMIPGPIQPGANVLAAMGSPVRAHYGPEWTGFYNATIALLGKLFGTSGSVFLMVGSGSCAIDACLGSAFSSGEKIIIGNNGFFGERLMAIAESYGLEWVVVDAEWGQPLRPENFEAAIRRHPDAVGVAVVHLETSTTIVNPIQEIGGVVRKHGLFYMVDAVSSLGGLPMCMDEWGIDLCASASQKCLGAPPGLGPVAVGPRGWEAIDRNPNKGHGWYGNLRVWRQYAINWADWHPFPVTLATNNIVALRASLDDLLEDGIERRLERYRSLALYLRHGLRRIGMTPYTPDEQMAPVITAAFGPAGVPTSQIVSYLANTHKIKIAGGLGLLKDKIIRIGHMSPTVTAVELDRVLQALGDYLAHAREAP